MRKQFIIIIDIKRLVSRSRNYDCPLGNRIINRFFILDILLIIVASVFKFTRNHKIFAQTQIDDIIPVVGSRFNCVDNPLRAGMSAGRHPVNIDIRKKSYAVQIFSGYKLRNNLRAVTGCVCYPVRFSCFIGIGSVKTACRNKIFPYANLIRIKLCCVQIHAGINNGNIHVFHIRAIFECFAVVRDYFHIPLHRPIRVIGHIDRF